MTTISIVPERQHEGNTNYRAVAGTLQSEGKTPGEALDALTSQLNETESSALVIVQQMRPDQFFTLAQQQRLAELMQRWRTARNTDTSLSPEEKVELEELVQAELQAATNRAASLIQQLER